MAIEKNIVDAHGNASEKSRVALLLIDTINDFDFPGSEELVESAHMAAQKLRDLKMECLQAGIPSIYVNDNFGVWRSVTGFAGNICVLFTANDAFMRGYKLVAVADCMASNSRADNDIALAQLEKVLDARVVSADKAISVAQSL